MFKKWQLLADTCICQHKILFVVYVFCSAYIHHSGIDQYGSYVQAKYKR